MLELLERYVEKFNRDDEETVKQHIGNAEAAQWMAEQVPLFSCSDPKLEEIYYFRWWVFRKHLKKIPEGFIITEFHPDVPWAGSQNSINPAVGHHLNEGRWLKNGAAYLEDYIRFWFRGSGNIDSYSCWIVEAVYEYCKLKGGYDLAVELLEDFVAFDRRVESANQMENGLFWSNDDRDAMEYSISGSGLRPTLNSYAAANVAAIAAIAGLAGRTELAEEFTAKAASRKELLNTVLWDEKDSFYTVIPTDSAQAQVSLSLEEIPPDHKVREEIGFIPWYFNLPDSRQKGAWRFLMDSRHFAAPFGPTTADQSHPRFRFPMDSHECLWNGPSWPFATTQTLRAMANLLCGYRQQEVTADDYFRLLQTYTNSHYRVNSQGKTICWLDENLEPFTGDWLSRTILKGWGWRPDKGGYERGKDYNHSGYCDLLIRDLLGVKPAEPGLLVLRPLVGDRLEFAIEELPYQGHGVSLSYNKENGFQVVVDGKEVHQSAAVEPVTLPLESVKGKP